MIRAKFRCAEVKEAKARKWDDAAKKFTDEEVKCAESVNFHAVYSSSPGDPNAEWSQATPSAQLSMYISNPGAWGKFEAGKEYFLDFTKAE